MGGQNIYKRNRILRPLVSVKYFKVSTLIKFLYLLKGMMIKTDKNREKSVLLDYTASLEESGKECSDLATALHLASAYLFSKNFKSILHFPGKLTPKVSN